MQSYLGKVFVIFMLFNHVRLAGIGFADEVNQPKEFYLELQKLSQNKNLTKKSWLDYISKVDAHCEKVKKNCEFFFMVESSLVMFEKDDYDDGGQCDRAQSNVELHFNGQLKEQEAQVKTIIDRLCPVIKK